MNIETLSMIVTGIIIVIIFLKIKGSARTVRMDQLPQASHDDIKCVRNNISNASETHLNAIAYYIRKGELIKAITLVRTVTSGDLKESKELVEKIKLQMK